MKKLNNQKRLLIAGLTCAALALPASAMASSCDNIWLWLVNNTGLNLQAQPINNETGGDHGWTNGGNASANSGSNDNVYIDTYSLNGTKGESAGTIGIKAVCPNQSKVLVATFQYSNTASGAGDKNCSFTVSGKPTDGTGTSVNVGYSSSSPVATSSSSTSTTQTVSGSSSTNPYPAFSLIISGAGQAC